MALTTPLAQVQTSQEELQSVSETATREPTHWPQTLRGAGAEAAAGWVSGFNTWEPARCTLMLRSPYPTDLLYLLKLGLTCDEASMLHGRVLGPAADAPDTMD